MTPLINFLFFMLITGFRYNYHGLQQLQHIQNRVLHKDSTSVISSHKNTFKKSIMDYLKRKSSICFFIQAHLEPCLIHYLICNYILYGTLKPIITNILGSIFRGLTLLDKPF